MSRFSHLALGISAIASVSASGQDHAGHHAVEAADEESLVEFFRKLFTSDFMPHGHCYFWKPEIVWLHVISDALIALAYYCIPVMLVYLIRKRHDLAFGWMFGLFGLFIFTCGTTHVMEIWTLWRPTYRLSGLVSAITAVASVATAVMLYRLLPLILILPSPSQLATKNAELKNEISSRKKAQLEITRANERLKDEAIVRGRYEQELQQANRMKSEFLANMSHELRTPLNGIIGFSEFLIDGKPGPLLPKQSEYLGDVLSSARHLLQLINEVLDLSKIEAGKMELHLETFALRGSIDEAVAVIRETADQKHVALATEVEVGLDAVTLDPQKFKQVLFNLLSNAVKFSDDGGKVEIRAFRPDPLHLEVRVSDTGIGIREADIPRLFVEFKQLESGNARRFGGTGLGLALTRKIVELQGGAVSVESEIGKGSTFIVRLPLIETEDGP